MKKRDTALKVLFKRLKSKKTIEEIASYIIVFSFIGFLLYLFYFLFRLYYTSYKGVLNILNIEPSFILIIVGGISFILLSSYFLITKFKNILKPYLKTGDKKSLLYSISKIVYEFSIRVNLYVIFTILLISTITVMGASYYTKVFNPELPATLKFSDYDYPEKSAISLTELYCLTKHETYVTGDILNCKFEVTYNQNTTYRLSRLIIAKKNSDDIYWDFKNKSFERNVIYKPIWFSLPLENEGSHSYKVDLIFENIGNVQRDLYFVFLDFDIKSLGDYNDRSNRKIIYFIGLITLTSLTVTATIRNLKELMEPKK